MLNGWDVKIFDPDPESERKISAVLNNARRALPMLVDAQMPTEGNLTYCTTLEQAAKRCSVDRRGCS